MLNVLKEAPLVAIKEFKFDRNGTQESLMCMGVWVL